MKTKASIIILIIVSAISLQPSFLRAQGALTPPGPPAPTMKTASQIEPRTPISSAPFTIMQPGSYYLTTNVTVSTGDGIDIVTNGVTLDLNGFTISSTAASAAGIGILLNSGLRNITIANGFIQGGVTNNGSGVYGGSGFAAGITAQILGPVPVNVLVSKVSISGCLVFGIVLGTGDSTVVESCTVRTVGNYGIVASTIKSSLAIDCGTTAISGDQVSDSRGQCSGSGDGLDATTALNCYGYSSSGNGLDIITAQNCYGESGSGNGLAGYIAQNCYGISDGSGDGAFLLMALNCYGISYSGNGEGLYAANTAQSCYGQSDSGEGLYGFTVQNCNGSSSSGTGIHAYDIATGSYGRSTTGTGLQAFIANSCDGGGTPALDVTYKYNMP